MEEILNEAKSSEEKAKKAMVDAARLADELRVEQEFVQSQDKARKAMDSQIKELQQRLEIAENEALKGSKKAIAKLEDRIRGIENELDLEQRRHADAQKNMRKADRRVKELAFQADEDRKNHEKMQDLVEKLQQKIRTYKRQIEEAVSFFGRFYLFSSKLRFLTICLVSIAGGDRRAEPREILESTG